MAVKYVSEFSFPSEYGFHKPASNSGKGVAKGMSGYSKPRVGPSVVTGSSSGKGGGKFHSGAVPKFAKGGLARVPAVGKGGSEDRGIGKTAEHFQKISDKRSPSATRTEKSSGVQKPAFKSGGHATTPQRYKAGGSTLHESGCKCNYCSGGMAKKEGGHIKKAEAPVKMGEKTSWNKDDATSPGSFKRTPVGEKVTNKKAANSKFSAEGRNTEPATKQGGDVERMSGWSDFKKGGHAKKATTPQRFAKGGHATTPQRYAEGGEVHADRYETRDTNEHGGTEEPAGTTTSAGMKSGGVSHPKLKNLGQYAHAAKGGSVKATRTEHPGGHASGVGKVVNSDSHVDASEYEHSAGTPGIEHGDRHEMTSGEPHMAMGGMSRAPNPKRNAAIHAKQHKPSHKSQGMAPAMGALSGGMGAPQMPAMGGGMGPPPGAPPMGGPPPQAPGMGGGMPQMADGGAVVHVIHHHVGG